MNKNTESNISNQAFSFVSTENKSRKTLCRVLELHYSCSNEMYELYYSYARILKKGTGKYVNKRTLSMISTDPTCEILKLISNSPAYSQRLPIHEFSRLIRILLHHFMSQVCQQTIMTSRRMPKESQTKHLQRRRQILEHLHQQATGHADQNGQ